MLHADVALEGKEVENDRETYQGLDERHRGKYEHRGGLADHELRALDGIDQKRLERAPLPLARGGIDGEIHPTDE